MPVASQEIFRLLNSLNDLDILSGFLQALENSSNADVMLSSAGLMLGLLQHFDSSREHNISAMESLIALLESSANERTRGVYSEQEVRIPIEVLRRILMSEGGPSVAGRVGFTQFIRRLASTDALFQASVEDRNVLSALHCNSSWRQLLTLPDDPVEAATSEPDVPGLLGVDLVAEARRGKWLECPLVGQEEVLRQLIVVLQAGFQSPALLGEPGVGKSAIVEGLAYHVAFNPDCLISEDERNWRIFEISLAHLVSGTNLRGSLEDRLQDLIKLARQDRNVILYFDELHSIFDTNDETARRIANILKPLLARDLRCLGATTKLEFDKYMMADAALVDRFHPISVMQPDRREAVQILSQSRAAILGNRAIELQIDFEEAALEASVDLSIRFQPTRCLPRKAFQLARIAVQDRIGEILRRNRSADVPRIITRRDIASVLARYRKTPVDHILDPTGETRFNEMRTAITQQLIGQDHAVTATVNQVRLHARGWSAPQRPIGVFLLLGSPGVGKSQLARLLGAHGLSEPLAPVVVDMAMFSGQGQMAISQLIGSSAGYVGYGDATLFSKVRANPHCVVVMDEIEKAPEVYPILLSVLSGSAEDARHVPTDFSQTIIVLTSNALQQSWGNGQMQDEELAVALIDEAGFPAELVDRIDRILMFRHLSDTDLLSVLDLQIKARLAQTDVPFPKEVTEDRDVRNELIRQVRSRPNSSARDVSRVLDRYLRKYLEKT